MKNNNNDVIFEIKIMKSNESEKPEKLMKINENNAKLKNKI